jgi:Putative Ig domain
MRLVVSFIAAAAFAAVLAPGALAFRFTDEARAVPVGVVGQPYSHQLSMAGGCLRVATSIGPGSLPPGLHLAGAPSDETQNSWRIEGTPTQAGEFPFWIVARSLWPECMGDSTEEDWVIRVTGSGGGSTPSVTPPAPAPSPSLAIQQTSVPGADTGAAYATRFTASGGGSQSWSVVGGVLPVGIQLAGDGTLSGRATIAGDYTFTVRVQAGGGAAQKTFTIAVREGVTASIQATKQAEQGVALALRPAFAGGLAPHTWSLASGSLPAGVTLDAATGALSGTPTQAGTYELALKVADRDGRSATVQTQLVVNAPIALVTRALPLYVRAVRTSFQLETEGGVGKKRFQIVSGRLPVGLRLQVNGVLVGTPRALGRFRVVVRVTDGYKVTATRAYTLLVRR